MSESGAARSSPEFLAPLRSDAVRFRGFGKALTESGLICRHGGLPGSISAIMNATRAAGPPASPLRLHAGRFARAGWNSREWQALKAGAIPRTFCGQRLIEGRRKAR